MVVAETDPISQLNLPPGFRFYPTDEELLVQYLCRKVAGHHFSLQIIGEIDLYKYDPWVLPSKAMFGRKEWYFFSPRDRKYPNGSRPNRVAGSGYWKATGTDKDISSGGRKVGIKKALVFYVGKAPKGTKTNWIMHEYRLSKSPRKNGSTKLDDWVLCRIYKKSSGGEKPVPEAVSMDHNHGTPPSSSFQIDDVFESSPEFNDQFFSPPPSNSLQRDEKLSLGRLTSGDFDWATLAKLGAFPASGGGGSLALPPAECQGQLSNANNDFNDVGVPSILPLCHVDSPCGKSAGSVEEVQRGLRIQRVGHPRFTQQDPDVLVQSFWDSMDPFPNRCPNQAGAPGFWHGEGIL